MESNKNIQGELVALVKQAVATLRQQSSPSELRESKRSMEYSALLAVGRIEDAMLMHLIDESEFLHAAFELKQAVRQVSLRMERLFEDDGERRHQTGCFCFASSGGSNEKNINEAWGDAFDQGKEAFDRILGQAFIRKGPKNSISLSELAKADRGMESEPRDVSSSQVAHPSLRLNAHPSNSTAQLDTLEMQSEIQPSSPSPDSRAAALMAAAVAAAFVGPDAAALPPFPLLEPAYSIGSSLGGLSSAGGSVGLGAHGAIISQLASSGYFPHSPFISPLPLPPQRPSRPLSTHRENAPPVKSHSSLLNSKEPSLPPLIENDSTVNDSVDPGMITLSRSATNGISAALSTNQQAPTKKESSPESIETAVNESEANSVISRTISHTKNKSLDISAAQPSPSNSHSRNMFPSLSFGGTTSTQKPSLSSKSRNSSLMDLVGFGNSQQTQRPYPPKAELEATSSVGQLAGGNRFKTCQIRKSSRKGPVDLVLFLSPPLDDDHAKGHLHKTDSLVSTQASTTSTAGSKSQAGHPSNDAPQEQQLLVVSGHSTFVYSSRLVGAHSDIVTSSPVTSAATHEGSGALWTGHLNGAIRLCLPRVSEAPTPLLAHPVLSSNAPGARKNSVENEIQPDPLATASSAPGSLSLNCWSISAMHVSEEGVLWAGDSSGRILAATYNPPLHAVVMAWPPKVLASPFSTPASNSAQTHFRVTSLICKHGIVAAATSLGNLCLIRCSDATQLGATSFGKAFGTCEAMAAVRWRPDQPRPPKNSEALGWRLITGHHCGQCLVWDLSNGRAAAVCSLGGRGSPVKGIGISYSPLDLLVLCFEDGRIAISPLPGASMSNLSSSAGGASKIPNWTLMQDIIVAHHSKITALACSCTTIATGSSIGGVKTWDLLELKVRAEAKGFSFPLSPRDSAGLYLQADKRDSSDPLPSPSSLNITTLAADSSFPGFTKSSSTSANNLNKPPPLLVGNLPSSVDASPAETPPRILPSGDRNSGNLPSVSMAADNSKPMSRSPSSTIISDWISMHGAGGSGGGGMGPAGLYGNLIKREELRIIEEIGRGAEGSVYRGRWHHIDVAVKEMHPHSASFSRLVSMAEDIRHTGQSMVFEAIVHELQALIDVSQHPNIIRFIGLCMDPPRIVTEYYPLGSLFMIIRRAREGDVQVTQQLSWARRLQMLHNIAAGMAYLHSRSYVHGDLRSPNIFVGLDGHVKIGDFGLARLLGEGESSSNTIGRTTNPRWLAPEVLRDGRTSRASDVFSFSIIMWEMLTWQIPYTGYLSLQVTFHHTTDDFRPDVPEDWDLPWYSQTRGPQSKVNLDPFKALMVECWHQDPDQRPSFSEVAARLSALMHWQSTVGRIRAQLAAATRGASASSTVAIQSKPVLQSSIGSHASSSSLLNIANPPPSPPSPPAPPTQGQGHHSEASNTSPSPAERAAMSTSDTKSELTGPFGNAFASAIAASEMFFRDGLAAGDSEGGVSANLSLSSSVISGPFGGAFGNASLAIATAIESSNAPGGGALGSWVSYPHPPPIQNNDIPLIPLSLPSKDSGGSHLPMSSGAEAHLPAMPMPGEPTTLLTPEAAAWLNSVMVSKKQQSKKQGASSSKPRAAVANGSLPPMVKESIPAGGGILDSLSFFKLPVHELKTTNLKKSSEESQSSVIPVSPILLPADGE